MRLIIDVVVVIVSYVRAEWDLHSLAFFCFFPNKDYKEAFGSDDYFTFWCGGVYNIVLNSQFFEDPSQVRMGFSFFFVCCNSLSDCVGPAVNNTAV